MRRYAWNVAAVAALIGLCGATAIGQAAKTVKDGIYTDEQAKRGETVYKDKCSACHGEDRSGGGIAPALNAEAFVQSWADRKLDEFWDKIKDTMPADNPGTLTAETNADLVAFLLKTAGYAAGQQALPTDVALLKQINIVKP